ncbi:MAG: class I SAM-dependent methyltransferase [Gallionella sp.]|nr:class I SAM-dependent methyltransferase [Gallionella sp.]
MSLQEKTAYSAVYAPLHLIDLVPATAQSILDVGAGPGGVGKVMRSRGFAGQIVAIEPVAERIAPNAGFYNEIHACYIEDFQTGQRFDVIMLADVLEHLHDPWQALKSLRLLLSPTGLLLVQVPNVMHPDFLLNFVCGDAQYVPAGICDITHIRWFNRLSITRAVQEAGYSVKAVSRVFKNDQERATANQPASGQMLRLANPQTGRELFIPASDLSDYLTFQYIVSAEQA